MFAHSYRWTMVPLVGGIALVAVLWPPRIDRRGGLVRSLDCALAISLVAIALQLVPLASGLRDLVAPGAAAFERAMRFDAGTGIPRPISIDPAATTFALVTVAAMVLLFWCLRGLFHAGGLRAAIRAIGWIGLFLSPLAILHHLRPLPIADVLWTSPARGIRPYGPFVNRNDFAAWLIMALPLTFGYLMARLDSRRRTGERFDPEVVLDPQSLWLGMAVCLMSAGLLVSGSRSGLLGASAGLVFFGWLAHRRLTTARAAPVAVGVGVMLVFAATFTDMNVLANRVESSFSEGFTGRFSIWQQTLPVVRDFWPLGSGVGTYQTAMIPYQTMSRFYYISHADNEFLQILAEGGVLLALPAAVAFASGVGLVVTRVRADRTPVFWLRLGAAAGMLALGVQNMVEMTLRVPANALLFTILGAIALHESQEQRP